MLEPPKHVVPGAQSSPNHVKRRGWYQCIPVLSFPVLSSPAARRRRGRARAARTREESRTRRDTAGTQPGQGTPGGAFTLQAGVPPLREIADKHLAKSKPCRGGTRRLQAAVLSSRETPDKHMGKPRSCRGGTLRLQGPGHDARSPRGREGTARTREAQQRSGARGVSQRPH